MEQKLKGKPARIVGFTIGGLLIAFLLLSLVVKGKEAMDVLQKNYYSANTMTVTGEGKITAMPDVAYVGYDIEIKDKDVKTVMEKNKETIKNFSSFLAGQGIKQDEVWVANFNIVKNTDTDAEGKENITYQLTDTIRVKIKDKEKLAEKIKTISDKAFQGGMTFSAGYSSYCNGDAPEGDRIGLYVDNQEAYITKATEKALEDARKHAKEQAVMTGLKLGDVVSFSDYSSFSNNCTVFVADFINPIEIKKSISVNFEVRRDRF